MVRSEGFARGLGRMGYANLGSVWRCGRFFNSGLGRRSTYTIFEIVVLIGMYCMARERENERETETERACSVG